MKVHIIEGTIEELRDGFGNPARGHANSIGMQKYSHVKFVDDQGAATLVTNLKVLGPDAFMQEGNAGVFLVSKGLFSKELFAVRIGNQERAPRDRGLLLAYVGLTIAAAISLALSFVIVGIPFFIATLWAMIVYPSVRAKKRAALEQAGFGRLVPDPVAKVI